MKIDNGNYLAGSPELRLTNHQTDDEIIDFREIGVVD
jgi:hypothetical protein